MDNRKPYVNNTYMKAPFDGRLLAQRLISRSGFYLAACLAGAVLAGGIYYILAIAFGPEETYQAVSSYYVDYTSLPEAIGDSNYNDAGDWEAVLRSDDFTAILASDLPDNIGNPALKASLSVIMNKDNDVRYYKLPSIAVTAHDPTVCMQISDAVNEHFPEFALRQEHVTAVRRADTATGADNISPSPRLPQAVILGSLLGLFISVTICFIYEMKSRDVWLPSMLTAKYGLRAAGSPEDSRLSMNLEYMFQSCHTMALIAPETAGSPEGIYEKLLTTCGTFMSGKRWEHMLSAQNVIEDMSILNRVDGVLLIIPSGHTAKSAKAQPGNTGDSELYTITEKLNQQDKSGLKAGCVLWNADEALIRRYYRV